MKVFRKENPKTGLRVYISGPISGTENYKESFEATERKLLRCGFSVANPCKNGIDEKAPYAEHLLADILMLKECDYIYYLTCSTFSNGAKIEREFAEAFGIAELCEKQPYCWGVITN